MGTFVRIGFLGSITSYQDAAAQEVRQALEEVLSPGTELVFLPVKGGPREITCSYEMYFSQAAVARLCREVEQQGLDAVVISAFLDNGIDAARELLDIPVVGPGRVSMYLASLLGSRFSVIMAKGHLERHVKDLALVLGVERKLASVRTTEMAVAEFLRQRQQGLEVLEREARLAVQQEGADVIVLGCGTMTGLGPRLQARLGLPVLDPGRTAVKFAETLAVLGLRHSRLTYPKPDSLSLAALSL